VYRVNKMRGHQCVFQAAKLSVEQQCGRRFLVQTLDIHTIDTCLNLPGPFTGAAGHCIEA